MVQSDIGAAFVISLIKNFQIDGMDEVANHLQYRSPNIMVMYFFELSSCIPIKGVGYHSL